MWELAVSTASQKFMITKIDRELAEQIVNTIKDVCDHDINFIAPSGIILASTDSSRVGTFHEIGQQAADSGSVLEVTEDNNFRHKAGNQSSTLS